MRDDNIVGLRKWESEKVVKCDGELAPGKKGRKKRAGKPRVNREHWPLEVYMSRK